MVEVLVRVGEAVLFGSIVLVKVMVDVAVRVGGIVAEGVIVGFNQSFTSDMKFKPCKGKKPI